MPEFAAAAGMRCRPCTLLGGTDSLLVDEDLERVVIRSVPEDVVGLEHLVE